MASGYMFSHYWPGDGVQNNNPVATAFQPNYPYGAVCSFLGLGYWPSRSMRKSLMRVRHNLWKLFPRKIQTAILALRLIFGSDYNLARESVEFIAQAPLLKDDMKWNAEMHRRVNADPNVHENICRFLAAADRMPRMDRNRRDTLLHLAWLGRKSV